MSYDTVLDVHTWWCGGGGQTSTTAAAFVARLERLVWAATAAIASATRSGSFAVTLVLSSPANCPPVNFVAAMVWPEDFFFLPAGSLAAAAPATFRLFLVLRCSFFFLTCAGLGMTNCTSSSEPSVPDDSMTMISSASSLASSLLGALEEASLVFFLVRRGSSLESV